jgi:hypothetical protein
LSSDKKDPDLMMFFLTLFMSLERPSNHCCATLKKVVDVRNKEGEQKEALTPLLKHKQRAKE